MVALLRPLRGRIEILAAFGAAIVLFAFAVIIEPTFGGSDNVRSVWTQASFIGIAALGQTLVILTGGIDLSVPWVMSSSALMLATLASGSNDALVWAIPVTLAYGATIGLVNGTGVAIFGISPIIMTLAVNTILTGASSMINESLNATLPSAITELHTTSIGPLNVDIAVWLLAAAVITIVLAWTAYGRRVYAVGTSERVAQFSGLNTTSTRIVAYVVSGLSAACAGIMVGGYGGQAFGGLGDPYLFSSVAAVAIGGASIYGGSGSYVGTVAGALVLSVLAGLLPILDLNPAALSIVYGVVILITVSLVRLRHNDGAAH